MKKPMKKVAKKASKAGMVEKRTGEKYASKGAMKRHERSEGKSERMREYGKRGK